MMVCGAFIFILALLPTYVRHRPVSMQHFFLLFVDVVGKTQILSENIFVGI